jgi:hypothetical protein
LIKAWLSFSSRALTAKRSDAEEESLREGNTMEAILALVTLFVIWALVIWGSMYFNKNVV